MMYRALLEKELPRNVIAKFNYPHEIEKPEKNYIFVIPKDGLVYDYRYIKEVYAFLTHHYISLKYKSVNS